MAYEDVSKFDSLTVPVSPIKLINPPSSPYSNVRQTIEFLSFFCIVFYMVNLNESFTSGHGMLIRDLSAHSMTELNILPSRWTDIWPVASVPTD
jgi:hypothetical protein